MFHPPAHLLSLHASPPISCYIVGDLMLKPRMPLNPKGGRTEHKWVAPTHLCVSSRTVALCECSVSASPAHVAGDSSVLRARGGQVNSYGSHFKWTGSPMHTEARLPRGAPIRQLGTHEPTRSLPTVLHSPVGTVGLGGQCRGRRASSHSEAAAVQVGTWSGRID